MHEVLVVARLTFLLLVRRRTLLQLAGAMALVLGVPLAARGVTGLSAEGLRRAGMLAASVPAFAGMVCAAGAVGREREHGTLSVLLARPLGPIAYLLGRALGVMAMVWALIAGLLAALLMIHAVRGTTLERGMWFGIMHTLAGCELGIMFATAVGAWASRAATLMLWAVFADLSSPLIVALLPPSHSWPVRVALEAGFWLAPFVPLGARGSSLQAYSGTAPTATQLLWAAASWMDGWLYGGALLVVAGLWLGGGRAARR